jgi:uncharacterized phiE125 gp8 family phage protein
MNQGFYGHPLHEGLTCLTPPAVEPVSLTEAKAYLRVEIDDDDDLVLGLITAARVYCESYTKSQFITATYKLILDQFPVVSSGFTYVGPQLRLPLPPLQSVTTVQYLDMDGNLQNLNTDLYTIDTDSKPGRIVPVYYQPFPVTRPQPAVVQVTFVAGYGDNGTTVPESVKTAIKLLVNHYYRNREAVSSNGLQPVPLAVDSLLIASMPGIY